MWLLTATLSACVSIAGCFNDASITFPRLPRTGRVVATPPGFSPRAVDKLSTIEVNAFDVEDKISAVRPSRDLLRSNALRKIDGNVFGDIRVEALTPRTPNTGSHPDRQLPIHKMKSSRAKSESNSNSNSNQSVEDTEDIVTDPMAGLTTRKINRIVITPSTSTIGPSLGAPVAAISNEETPHITTEDVRIDGPPGDSGLRKRPSKSEEITEDKLESAIDLVKTNDKTTEGDTDEMMLVSNKMSLVDPIDLAQSTEVRRKEDFKSSSNAPRSSAEIGSREDDLAANSTTADSAERTSSPDVTPTAHEGVFESRNRNTSEPSSKHHNKVFKDAHSKSESKSTDPNARANLLIQTNPSIPPSPSNKEFESPEASSSHGMVDSDAFLNEGEDESEGAVGKENGGSEPSLNKTEENEGGPSSDVKENSDISPIKEGDDSNRPLIKQNGESENPLSDGTENLESPSRNEKIDLNRSDKNGKDSKGPLSEDKHVSENSSSDENDDSNGSLHNRDEDLEGSPNEGKQDSDVFSSKGEDDFDRPSGDEKGDLNEPPSNENHDSELSTSKEKNDSDGSSSNRKKIEGSPNKGNQESEDSSSKENGISDAPLVEQKDDSEEPLTQEKHDSELSSSKEKGDSKGSSGEQLVLPASTAAISSLHDNATLDQKEGSTVFSEYLMKSVTAGDDSRAFERDCRHNRSTLAIECVERRRNSSEEDDAYDTCRRYSVIAGRIYDLVEFPCRQVFPPMMGSVMKAKSAKTELKDLLKKQETSAFRSTLSPGRSDGSIKGSQVTQVTKATKTAILTTTITPQSTIQTSVIPTGSTLRKGKTTRRPLSSNIRLRQWQPFHLNCEGEHDEFKAQCRDWAVAGYCETNNATKFLWCRRTCLCDGPPSRQ